MEKKGIGVILEGGGVKGAYHVGALKAFEEAGFEFSGYAGTSIGALNAAQLCQTSERCHQKKQGGAEGRFQNRLQPALRNHHHRHEQKDREGHRDGH